MQSLESPCQRISESMTSSTKSYMNRALQAGLPRGVVLDLSRNSITVLPVRILQLLSM